MTECICGKNGHPLNATSCPVHGVWRPIETAPKDGARILAYGKIGFESFFGIGTVKWEENGGRWIADPNEATEFDYETCDLTHWSPLPEPPIPEKR